MGFCSPVLSLIAGGLAGFFAARLEKPPTEAEGARAGAIAGSIAGSLIILGQIIGGMGALYMMQTSGMTTIFGQVLQLSSETSQIPYYLGGFGTALGFGIIGALLAAGAGTVAGYLGTIDRQATPPSSYPMR